MIMIRQTAFFALAVLLAGCRQEEAAPPVDTSVNEPVAVPVAPAPPAQGSDAAVPADAATSTE